MEIDAEQQRAMNMTVLRRLDGAIFNIMAQSSHVSLYSFDEETKSWQREEVEGPLFIVERHGSPSYQYVILNRLGIDNTVNSITNSLKVQRSERFLIGRDSSGSTVGIWFYDIEECNMVYNTIKALKDRLKADVPGAGGAEDGGDDLQRLFGAASKAAPARSSHMASSSDPHPLLQILHQSTDALSQPRPFDNGVGGSGGDALRTTLVGGLGAPGFEHIPLSAAGQQLPPPHGSSGAPYALAPMPSTQPSAVAVVGKEQIRASLQALAQNQVFIDIVHHTLLNRQQQ